MKLEKIYNAMIEDFLEMDCFVRVSQVFEHDGKKYVAVSLDGFEIYIISANEFPFDIRRFRDMNAEKILFSDYDDQFVEGIMTNQFEELNGREDPAVKLIGKRGDEDIEVFIDTCHLKNFENPEFKIIDTLNVVKVYENGQYVGVVLPLKIYDK